MADKIVNRLRIKCPAELDRHRSKKNNNKMEHTITELEDGKYLIAIKDNKMATYAADMLDNSGLVDVKEVIMGAKNRGALIRVDSIIDRDDMDGDLKTFMDSI